jgi:hypothetical protein
MRSIPTHTVALLVALTTVTGCTGRAEVHSHPVPARFSDDGGRRVPVRVKRPATWRGDTLPAPPSNEQMSVMRNVMLKTWTSLAVTFNLLMAAPVHAIQQIDAQLQDRPIVRRRAPEGQRRGTLAFVRSELYFGTAKPRGVVTEEEFRQFLDDVVTPLFPDGVTVLRADGQFRGASRVTIKEESFVLVLLYPLEGQKVSSRNIDVIRARYIEQHQQESVLRVDDPFLVWVSF